MTDMSKESEETDAKDREEAEPVWKRPAWITAIVGVISAFLTVPDVVGNYLAKEQDIEIAKQEVMAAEIRNRGQTQDLEFSVIQNSLGQQGEERVFMLRYFARTLDDPEARGWAQDEVDRLDRLAAIQTELRRQRLEIEAKTNELASLRQSGGDTGHLATSLAQLQAELAQKNLEVTQLRAEAGVAVVDEADEVARRLNEELNAQVAPLCEPAVAGRYPFEKSGTRDARFDELGLLFGPRGALDVYFETHLAGLVDTSGGRWRWRDEALAARPAAVASLRQFERAFLLRETFFAKGADDPHLVMTLTPVAMDPGAVSFQLEMDGQVMRYAHGPVVPVLMNWPGPGSPSAAFSFEPELPLQLLGTKASGAWAFLRLIDKLHSEMTSDRALLVEFQAASRVALIEIRFGNPLALRAVTALREFRCPDGF